MQLSFIQMYILQGSYWPPTQILDTVSVKFSDPVENMVRLSSGALAREARAVEHHG